MEVKGHRRRTVALSRFHRWRLCCSSCSSTMAVPEAHSQSPQEKHGNSGMDHQPTNRVHAHVLDTPNRNAVKQEHPDRVPATLPSTPSTVASTTTTDRVTAGSPFFHDDRIPPQGETTTPHSCDSETPRNSIQGNRKERFNYDDEDDSGKNDNGKQGVMSLPKLCHESVKSFEEKESLPNKDDHRKDVKVETGIKELPSEQVPSSPTNNSPLDKDGQVAVSLEKEERVELKKQVLKALVEEPTLEEMQTLFQLVDQNGDGTLSLKEIEKAMFQRIAPQFDLKPTILFRAFAKADVDGNGCIDKDEFFDFLRMIRYFDNLRYVFALVDTDGDHRWSQQEFWKAADILSIQQDPEQVFQDMDQHMLGYIVFDDFCFWMVENRSSLSDVARGVQQDP